jgi:hypothetical protein
VKEAGCYTTTAILLPKYLTFGFLHSDTFDLQCGQRVDQGAMLIANNASPTEGEAEAGFSLGGVGWGGGGGGDCSSFEVCDVVYPGLMPAEIRWR